MHALIGVGVHSQEYGICHIVDAKDTEGRISQETICTVEDEEGQQHKVKARDLEFGDDIDDIIANR